MTRSRETRLHGREEINDQCHRFLLTDHAFRKPRGCLLAVVRSRVVQQEQRQARLFRKGFGHFLRSEWRIVCVRGGAILKQAAKETKWSTRISGVTRITPVQAI